MSSKILAAVGAVTVVVGAVALVACCSSTDLSVHCSKVDLGGDTVPTREVHICGGPHCGGCNMWLKKQREKEQQRKKVTINLNNVEYVANPKPYVQQPMMGGVPPFSGTPNINPMSVPPMGKAY